MGGKVERKNETGLIEIRPGVFMEKSELVRRAEKKRVLDEVKKAAILRAGRREACIQVEQRRGEPGSRKKELKESDSTEQCPVCGEGGPCQLCSERGKLKYEENGKIVPTLYAIAKVQEEHGIQGTNEQATHVYQLAQAQTLIDAYLAGQSE
jgi:hypothetical protein